MKIWSKYLIVAPLSVLLLFARTHTDYDKQVDFTKYKTYSWIRVDTGDKASEDKVKSSIDSQLSAKGWQRIETGGDASVSALGSIKSERVIQTMYDSWGIGWRWNAWGSKDLSTVETIPIGNLTIHIFDTQTKQLIWKGSTSGALSENPEKGEKKLTRAVTRLFKKFPPPSNQRLPS